MMKTIVCNWLNSLYKILFHINDAPRGLCLVGFDTPWHAGMTGPGDPGTPSV